jgi:hypothetical protein
VQELAQHARGIRIEPGRIDRAIHQVHPSIPRRAIDGKRQVAHAQPRVAALFDVAWRPAEAADEEVAQPRLGAHEILGRIHRAQHVVVRHLLVEGAHQPGEAVFADASVDLLFGQIHNIQCMSEEAPKSAYELAMERLRRKDADEGVEERAVSDEQKAEIAEVRRVYAAKVAEAEILHKSKIVSVVDPEERMKLDDGHRRDLLRLQEERERKLAKIRR